MTSCMEACRERHQDKGGGEGDQLSSGVLEKGAVRRFGWQRCHTTNARVQALL